MTKGILVEMFGAFAPMSVLGGANSIIPELHRQVVDVHAWMSSEEFATLFAVAQAAPGPNILIVSLIGWQVAGLEGLLAATVAINAPHCLLTYFIGGIVARATTSVWVRAFKEALVPMRGPQITTCWPLRYRSPRLATSSSRAAIHFGRSLLPRWPASPASTCYLSKPQSCRFEFCRHALKW